jgi:hypothetical protein
MASEIISPISRRISPACCVTLLSSPRAPRSLAERSIPPPVIVPDGRLLKEDQTMRLLAIAALVFVAPLVATTLAACGTSHHDTTVIAQPGSTVVAPAGAKVVREHDGD